MAYDKFWMITNVADAYDGYRGEYIPEKQAPRFLHPDRGQAESELLRLQQRHPHSEFVLLEAVAKAVPKTMLIIEPITAFLAIENIDPDPEIPF